MQNQSNELDQLAEELTLRCEVDEHGDIYYYNKDNRLHRVYGPAVIYSSKAEFWLRNGKRHRLDGPATIYPDGYINWYINGSCYTEEEFNAHPDVIAYAKSR